MKGKNPTRNQKILLKERRLNPSNWLVLKNPSNQLVVKNRVTGKIRTIEL